MMEFINLKKRNAALPVHYTQGNEVHAKTLTGGNHLTSK